MKQSNQEQLEQALAEKELMRQLGTASGFYAYYFKQLPNYKTQVECFNAVHEKYFELFGEYLYSSYHSFAASKLYRKKK